MPRSTLSAMLVLAMAAVSCASRPGPKPAVPAENDPAYDVGGIEQWYLVGDELTAGEDTLDNDYLSEAVQTEFPYE